MIGKYQLCAMKTGVSSIALLVLMALFASGDELPKVLVTGLGADDFKERENSQKKLLEWATKEKKSPAVAFYQLFKKSEDPEVRQRCYEILKGLSDRDYLKDGKGFLGITMLPDNVVLPGEEKPRAAVKITNIVKNGPAEKFGLKIGDVIIALDGKKFEDGDATKEFSRLITAKKPLDDVLLGLKRLNGKIDEMKVVLAKHPGENLNALRHNLHLLDERARERHFKTWFKMLEDKAG